MNEHNYDPLTENLLDPIFNLGVEVDGYPMSSFSSFLFARPSFWEGCARILDLGGTLQVYNQSPTPQAEDYYAMVADWRCVGQDLQAAMNAAAQQGWTGDQEIVPKEPK